MRNNVREGNIYFNPTSVATNEDRWRATALGEPKAVQAFINKISSTFPEALAKAAVLLLHNDKEMLVLPLKIENIAAAKREDPRAIFVGALAFCECQVALVPAYPASTPLLEEAFGRLERDRPKALLFREWLRRLQ